ncbi:MULTISPECIES: hypothetical protein [unclassified Sinorhizobium]
MQYEAPPQEQRAFSEAIQDELELSFDPSFLLPIPSHPSLGLKVSTFKV